MAGGAARVKRTHGSLNEQLRWQLEFLHASAERYEQGHEHEALRLAVTLRVLFHDEGRGRSLLTQLDMRETTDWVDTNDVNPCAQPWGFLLVEMPQGYPPRYAAPLASSTAEVRRPFAEWWRGPLLTDERSTAFSREYIVTRMANQDGGAHVDPNLDEAYHALSRGGTLHYGGRTSEVSRTARTPAFEVVRQIAYEVQQTFFLNWGEHAGPPTTRKPSATPTVILRSFHFQAGDQVVGPVLRPTATGAEGEASAPAERDTAQPGD